MTPKERVLTALRRPGTGSTFEGMGPDVFSFPLTLFAPGIDPKQQRECGRKT